MNFEYRRAIPDDAAHCVVLRGKTRQNACSVQDLAAIGITPETWRESIENGSCPGYVCLSNSEIVGMCFGDKDTGEILVVAILPNFENFGIGKLLLEMTLEELKNLGYTRSFLGCNASPSSRSYGFYRHLGWRSTGKTDSNGDEILEISIQ